MQSSNNRNYIISGIVAVVVIALIAGSYYFDHRYDALKRDNQATSTIDTATTTTATTTLPSKPAASAGSAGAVAGIGENSNLIRLESYTISRRSDISNWTMYSNSAYRFSLQFPGSAQVRKFVDGKNEEYGIGLTLQSGNSHFTDKYFELITDSGKTTVCDALLPKGTTAKTSDIGGIIFIRNEYNDNTDHIIEYNARANGVCNSASLRLHGAAGTDASRLSSSEIQIESQLLEDIMSTFKVTK